MAVGLGCRSGAYLIYAGVSTLVWILMLVSSICAHASTFRQPDQEDDPNAHVFNRSSTISPPGREDNPNKNLLRRLSITLRRLGKVIATCNAVWIVVMCIFQFSKFFSRCFCNSSVFGLGDKAYNVIILTSGDVPGMRSVWIGAVVLALGSAFLYTAFVNIFINPPLPG